MIRRLIPALALLPAALLAACAPHASPRSAPRPLWAMSESDIVIDPAFRTGTLPNGLRYIVRRGTNPAGTAQVRMQIDAGSLDETDAERGYAHFVEHMAFNGSTRVPEGDMVRLLERAGLAFGADTNAQTSFDYTLYTLDLPRNDPALLDTALMLMRETASGLTFAPAAVARERGVILAEKRDRNTWNLRTAVDAMTFANPRARYVARLPIGTDEALTKASAETLRRFWQRHYTPSRTTLIVIGDLDPAATEAAIRQHFADWTSSPAAPRPSAGPVDFSDRGRTAIYLDPALSERVTASRHAPWLDERDSAAQRRENLLRQIGYDIINRRLLRLSRLADAPFRGAGLGTSDVFRAGRTTSLVVDTVDGGWQRGLAAAVAEYRLALKQGFTAAEVEEQLAVVRAAHRNAAAGSATRPNASLVGAALALVRDDVVPATPESSLARLETFAPQITPAAVLAALRRELVPLSDPLLRFAGRQGPQGGAGALRDAWHKAIRGKLVATAAAATASFAYTDFGMPSAIASDTREPLYGIRQVRFANGVRLNLRRTGLEQDRVQIGLTLDGGDLLRSRAQPLATELAGVFAAGGLGKHSQDQLDTILAGKTVGFNLAAGADASTAYAQTTPEDLGLQLQLIAAYLIDPGYRPEGEVRYRQYINTFFARKDATPGSALNTAQGAILSDSDPRFTLQPVEAYRKLDFAGLRQTLGDRLSHGAIELGVVGDIDEDRVIALVGATLGALPAREPEFRTYAESRQRSFTHDTSRRIVPHDGPADQAMLRLIWPTRDGDDPVAFLQLELLERVARIALTESLRERLGKAYSPSADSDMPRVWPGWGTFSVTASINLADLPATREAVAATVAELRKAPVSDDMLQRARQPLLEAIENGLKTDRGWLALVDRAQTQPDRLERQRQGSARLRAITAQDLLQMAQRYLQPETAVEIDVVPREVAAGGER